MDTDLPRIVRLIELINAESKSTLFDDVTHLCKKADELGAGGKIGCHDCGCAYAKELAALLDVHIFLDTWHARGHKCSKELFDPANDSNVETFKELDSERCEREWRGFNRFTKMTGNMTRPNFR